MRPDWIPIRSDGRSSNYVRRKLKVTGGPVVIACNCGISCVCDGIAIGPQLIRVHIPKYDEVEDTLCRPWAFNTRLANRGVVWLPAPVPVPGIGVGHDASMG